MAAHPQLQHSQRPDAIPGNRPGLESPKQVPNRMWIEETPRSNRVVTKCLAHDRPQPGAHPHLHGKHEAPLVAIEQSAGQEIFDALAQKQLAGSIREL